MKCICTSRATFAVSGLRNVQELEEKYLMTNPTQPSTNIKLLFISSPQARQYMKHRLWPPVLATSTKPTQKFLQKVNPQYCKVNQVLLVVTPYNTRLKCVISYPIWPRTPPPHSKTHT